MVEPIDTSQLGPIKLDPAAEPWASLRRVFGYAPDESDGEKWIVYEDRCLIVIHPYRRPRVYSRNGRGLFYEIEPLHR